MCATARVESKSLSASPKRCRPLNPNRRVQSAQAFAKRALRAGHKVKLSNNRGPESLREIVNRLGPGAMAATKEEAAACEMVLLAVPWDNVPETLASLPKWKNQILIDGTNPFHGQ